MESRVYLDWAATALLCTEAYDAMLAFLAPGRDNAAYGANANSLHTEGRNAFNALEEARLQVASCIGARPDEVYFTSGATESDNLAVIGLARHARDQRIRKGRPFEQAPRVIIGGIEHGAIGQAADILAKEGFSIDIALPDATGRIDPARIGELATDDTLLVSVMYANNEVGSIQDIAAICKQAHDAGCLMHTDAAQALAKVRIDCHGLDVDAASFSSHKICGPKGVGALYLKRGVAIDPLMVGGGQEHGVRSGTQNVAGIAGFAAACMHLCHDEDARAAEQERQTQLRTMLYEGLCALPGVQACVPCLEAPDNYLCNVVSVTVDGFESETLILRCDLNGFAVSGGSACSSHSLEPSKVLSRLGIPRDRALGALRISLGIYTTQEDVERFLSTFPQVIAWNE